MVGTVTDGDRALLWLAAHVAGLEAEIQTIDSYQTDRWLTDWQPLLRDADAHHLLLALGKAAGGKVSLELVCGPIGEASYSAVSIADRWTIREPHAQESATPTRRAIVRAAACFALETLAESDEAGRLPKDTRPEQLQCLGELLRQRMEHFRRQAHAEAAIRQERDPASTPVAVDPSQALQGKRLIGRGTIGLKPELINEVLEMASASGYRLYLLAGNEAWIKQDYLIVHPEDMKLLPRHLSDPYLALASGQGLSIYPIDTNILEKPFGIVRLSW